MDSAVFQAESMHFTARLAAHDLIAIVDDIKDFFALTNVKPRFAEVADGQHFC
jgi:hypothetical protein